MQQLEPESKSQRLHLAKALAPIPWLRHQQQLGMTGGAMVVNGGGGGVGAVGRPASVHLPSSASPSSSSSALSTTACVLIAFKNRREGYSLIFQNTSNSDYNKNNNSITNKVNKLLPKQQIERISLDSSTP